MRMLVPLVGSGLALAGTASAVLAHGVTLEVNTAPVEVRATYDGGTPMSAAQVLVYAPDNPEEPWTEGLTDEQGRYVFTPDSQRPGTWEVVVRQAGHGEVTTLAVGAASAAAAAAPAAAEAAELSPLRQWATVGAGLWGFVGTALFFSRGKR